jgi:hypothetical protein
MAAATPRKIIEYWLELIEHKLFIAGREGEVSMQQASDSRYSNYSNLSAGSLAEPGIYVVSHRVHAVPHEVIIRRSMILPHCKICGNVRYSWKCSLPQDIEENDFFFDVNPVPISLFARVLANTVV